MDSSLVLVLILLCVSVFALSLVSYKIFTAALNKYQSDFKMDAETNLADMFIFVDPSRLLIIGFWVLLVSSLLVWLITGNLIISVFLAGILAASPRLVYSFLHAKRREKFNLALPDALSSIAAMLRAGSNLSSALELMVHESKGPIQQEFGLLLREVKMGVDFNVSMDNMLQRISSDELQMTVAGMKIARDVGGSLAEVLERLSDTIRKKIEIEGKIRSLTAMGKAQGVVMALLPFVVGFAIAQIEPDAVDKFFTTYIGWGACAVIVVMELMGFWFIRKIVAIDV